MVTMFGRNMAVIAAAHIILVSMCLTKMHIFYTLYEALTKVGK